jgi:ABC-type Fe3+/spermidine/putrescine transport system ATPase subunit
MPAPSSSAPRSDTAGVDHPAAPASAATTHRASDVTIENVSHHYTHEDVLSDVSLRVEHGEVLTLLGPSGSGKSTLLRIVGGLERPRAGTVHVGTRDITHLPPERREIGIVFQNYALFPHMSVGDNVEFPLRLRGVDRSAARTRARDMLSLVELAGAYDRKPSELSGGQQQRVALARALVFEPRVLLLDEPFGALDRRLREQLGLEVRRVQRELGVTTIFVTHDQDEAFTMSTRIAVMGHGQILQVDTPAEVYRDPARVDVARYLGNLSEFEATLAKTNGSPPHARGPAGMRVEAPGVADVDANQVLRCGVRPEHVEVASSPSDTHAVEATVRAAIFGGSWVRAQLVLNGGHEILATLPREQAALSDGDRVWVGVKREHWMLFDATSGQRIS